MRSRSANAVLALAALAALAASPLHAQGRGVGDPSAPRALQDSGPVQVQWDDPRGFTEIRYSRNRFEAQRGDWVQRLAEHLRQQAEQAIGPGERLELRITDIDLAGEYEPLATDLRDVRVVRDIYPPRMELSFVRYGADGQVMQQGSRRLSDPGFLSAPAHSTQDSLRFEKRMIEDWVRREFRPAPQQHDRRPPR